MNNYIIFTICTLLYNFTNGGRVFSAVKLEYHPYPVAGPDPAINRIISHSPQTITDDPTMPNSVSSEILSNELISGANNILFCGLLPIFIWLLLAGKVAKMRNIYCSAMSFIAIYIITITFLVEFKLNLLFSILVGISVSSYASYYSFNNIHKVWPYTMVFSVLLIENLMYMITTPFLGLNSAGWATYISFLRPQYAYYFIICCDSIFIYLILSLFEFYHKSATQSAIVSFTSTFMAISSISYIMVYFIPETIGIFEPFQFFGLPVRFKFNNIECISLLLLLITLCSVGYYVQQIQKDQELDLEQYGFTTSNIGKTINPYFEKIKIFLDPIRKLYQYTQVYFS